MPIHLRAVNLRHTMRGSCSDFKPSVFRFIFSSISKSFVGVALKSTRFASRISTPGRAGPDPPSGGDLFIFERAKRCLLVALRKISLQCNDLSLSEAKQTLASGLPGEFMSSRPSSGPGCHAALSDSHCGSIVDRRWLAVETKLVV
jgi:hypothetical protein